jgi:hypothetical protein
VSASGSAVGNWAVYADTGGVIELWNCTLSSSGTGAKDIYIDATSTVILHDCVYDPTKTTIVAGGTLTILNSPRDMDSVSNDRTAAATLELFAEALDQATGQIDAGTLHDETLTADAFAADAIAAAAVKADAVTKIGTGVWATTVRTLTSVVDLTTGLVAAIWAHTTRTLTAGVAQVVRSHQTGTLSIVRGESYLNADGNPISITKESGAAWPTTISGWTIKLAFLEQASNVEVAGTTPTTITGTVVTATGDSQAVRFDMTKVVTSAMATGHAVYKYSVWATSGDSAVELEQGTADVTVGVAT